MTSRKTADYLSLTNCSFNSSSMPTGGFESGWQITNAYSCINVSALIKTVGGVFSIYLNSIKSDTYEQLYFTKELTADVPFYKRFIIPNTFFRIELLQSSGNPEGYINTAMNANNQFSAYTFLNSPINLNPDTQLQRVANDFQLDLVRGVHSNFQKVNIQGIERTIPAPGSSEVVGFGTTFRYQGSGETQMRGLSANDVPSGTGARSVRIVGILQDETAFDSVFGTGGASTGLLGLNIAVINRIIIESVGSGGELAGDIIFEDSVSGEQLGIIYATENSSRSAIYGIPSDKQLVLKDINICSKAPEGILTVREYKPSTNIFYNLGEFLIDTSYTQVSYNLDGLIPAGNIIQIEFKNTSSVSTGSISITCNVNGMLCPLVNNF